MTLSSLGSWHPVPVSERKGATVPGLTSEPPREPRRGRANGGQGASGALRGHIVLPNARWRGQRESRKAQGEQERYAQDSEHESGTAGYRLHRLWVAAEVRKVPLRTIIAAILAVAFFFLAAR